MLIKDMYYLKITLISRIYWNKFNIIIINIKISNNY